MKRILISTDPQEVRVAIIEGGKLVEAYIERYGKRSIVGNIYLARVDAVLPGMEAAFVDIGLEKNGFLYVNEIVMPDLDERERRRKSIDQLIKPGEELLVQVTKDPMGTKGARLTMEVSLAGRFMVLTPGADGIGVSRRLGDDERSRLRDLIKGVRTTEDDSGLIVRTAASGATVDELERDVRLLEKLWETTRGHAQQSAGRSPALVYTEPDLALQTVRDEFRSEVSEIVVDDEQQYERILSYVRRTSPELAENVKMYRGRRQLFQRFEIDQGIRGTLKRRVDLPSGGYLVFDYGEAFTVIDVNTGRYTGKKKLEDTILKNNLEAAVEVVRQIRLRDIGGIIVVDFVDMAAQKNRDAVLEVLQKELLKDRSKVYVVEISPLGLVEMTRKNISDGVREVLTRGCAACEGTGRVLSEDSLAIDARREIRQHLRETKAEAFHLATSPGVAALLVGPGGTALAELEAETERYFTIEGVDDLAPGTIEFRAEGTRDEIERAIPLPYAEGDEIVVRIDEPHMYVEGDAVARIAGGYVVSVTGAGRYLGEEHRVRIDRVMRTGAYATLLDAEPAAPALAEVDKESDLLEPERRIGERVDVEGRVKRQRRGRAPRKDEAHLAGRGAEDADIVSEDDEDRDRAERAAAAAMKEAALAAKRAAEEDVDDDEEVGDDEDDVVDDDGVAPARRRRRRRGGRGRRRSPSAAANGAEGSDDVRPERSPQRGPDRPPQAPAPAAASASSASAPAGEADPATSGDPDPDAPARRRRRRGGRGRGTRNGASANGAGSGAPAEGGAASQTGRAQDPATDRPPRAPRPPRPPRQDVPAATQPPPPPAPMPAAPAAPPAKSKRRRGVLARIFKGD